MFRLIPTPKHNYCIQSTASSLEEDIFSIEKQLAEYAKTLDLASNLERTQIQRLEIEETSLNVNDEYNRIHPTATTSQKDYNSLKGVQSWSPAEISEGNICLHTSGLSRQTCCALAFKLSTSKKPKLLSWHQSELRKTAAPSLRRYTGVVGSFLENGVGRLFTQVAEKTIHETVGVGSSIQNFSRCLGRLDIVALELQGLLDRYGGDLREKDCQTYQLSFEFDGRLSKMLVNFSIGSSYPWLPLEVQIDVLEGSVESDVENIRRSLKKNARIGFGALSRACDIVAAHAM